MPECLPLPWYFGDWYQFSIVYQKWHKLGTQKSVPKKFIFVKISKNLGLVPPEDQVWGYTSTRGVYPGGTRIPRYQAGF